jgi:cytochrome c-type biogenesis protein
MLPMLPIYISYFGGREGKKAEALRNSIGFVTGFTIVFVCLGAFAGSVGRLLLQYNSIVNLIAGIIIIIFGLGFMGLVRLPAFVRIGKANNSKAPTGFFSSLLFGIVFSVTWTPCIGTFLGSALMLAASSAGSIKGIFMLLSFSAGVGLPFIFSAVLIENLKSAFNLIKRHYKVINLICGALLVVVGILMATGLIGYFFSLLKF